MNTEDFVTYEQALALKKLGFDLGVDHVYNKDGELIEETRYMDDYTAYVNYNIEKYGGDIISAPTLSQAQKWLKKNKKIDIIVSLEDETYVQYQVEIYIRKKCVSPRYNHGFYETYEEALSRGITKSIEIIEKEDDMCPVKVVTAPEKVDFPEDSVKIFLAGGIQKCEDWQNELISMFEEYEYDHEIYLINPRRDNFPIDNPNAAEEQINWEFEMLEKCNVFTMLFNNSKSDQPICFYELGRNIERMKVRFPISWDRRIIISSDKDFKRIKDVEIQTKLATNDNVKVGIYPTYNLVEKHFNNICKNLRLTCI